MQAKKISFQNSRKQKLSAVLHTPDRKTSSIVIMAHGFAADKDEKGTFVELAGMLCKAGLAVLRFDFAGYGDSQGSPADTTITNEVDDLGSAIKYARKRKYRKVGILGASFGGTIAIISAATESVDCLLVWNPVVYVQKSLGELAGKYPVKKTKVTKNFFQDIRKYDVLSSAKRIDKPLFILHGESDSLIPYSDSWDLFKSIAGAKIEIIKGGQHNFHGERDLAIASQLSLNWFSRILG
ncbi:MAG: alpha/beta fold hydrolase [Candidatus Aenigmarchaeota archaeon]|nr:alpha/beta fold hydrolase [Candidatus Aenigmarchaeota archaeon]